MDRRTKIILFIFSIIVSIVMICFSYFGIPRYLQLHRGDLDSMNLDNYSKLEKAFPDRRMVISFGPKESRILKLDPVIKSVVDQTVKVDAIAINTLYSDKYPKKFEKVANIFNSGKNYGKGVNIIPTLLRETDKNTMILILEDNVVYGKDFIENIAAEALNNPGKVIIVENQAVLLQSPNDIDLEAYLKDSDGDLKNYIIAEHINLQSYETFNTLW
jgi:hypothetical protein